jgi:small-conductance mechanosensitive channel
MAHLLLALSLIPHWLVGAAIMLAPALLARLLYRWFMGQLARLAGRYSLFLRTLIVRGEGPLSAVLVIVVLGAFLPAARFPPETTIALAHSLLIAFILAIGWAAMRALDLGAEFYIRRFDVEVADNLLARKHLTQVHILRRTAQTMLVIVTIASALMTLATVRQYGVSLFASAGAAGLVVGLAARPVLSNLIAGVQIAVTQPIRVEDVVVVEGEWGWIETITSTYVVVRLWDLRRLIVPLSWFIENRFENWTYETAHLIGPVQFLVDYSVPVETVRQQFEAIVRASPLWDGRIASLQAIDALPTGVQLRGLVSAANARDLWNLRCEAREGLLAYLRQEYPGTPPHQAVVEILAADLPKAAAHRK